MAISNRWIHCAECGRNKRHVAHGLCRLCYDHQWRRANPEYVSPLIHCAECGRNRPHHAYGLCLSCCNRQYHEEHRDEVAIKHLAWLQANADHVHAYNLQWYETHQEEQRENSRQWARANPDKHREAERRRRARKRNATIEPVDEAAVYVLNGRMCIYCGATENLTLDHIVPIARGGSHSEDNLVVACGSCNSSKNAKPLAAWLQTQPYSIAWVF